MNPIRVSHILRATAEVTGIDPLVMISPSRYRPHVRARQMAMYIAREVCGRSYPDIGRRIGERDHTTVLHACRKVRVMLADCSTVQDQCDRIAERAREIAMKPMRENDPIDMGGPERDRRFTKTHQPDPEKRRAARMRKPDPMPFPDREPITHTPLPPLRPRAATQSNCWHGGWPSDEENRSAVKFGAANA